MKYIESRRRIIIQNGSKVYCSETRQVHVENTRELPSLIRDIKALKQLASGMGMIELELSPEFFELMLPEPKKED